MTWTYVEIDVSKLSLQQKNPATYDACNINDCVVRNPLLKIWKLAQRLGGIVVEDR
jgi:hypothetical protein